MKQIVLKIRGRVQGVFFRDSVNRKARVLGLVGWVRNESDGAVKIVAEGEEEDLKKLVEWCKSGGPELAKVDEVEENWQEFTGQFSSFEVVF